MNVTDNWLKANGLRRKNLPVGAVLLDFSKAFDLVDQKLHVIRTTLIISSSSGLILTYTIEHGDLYQWIIV